MKSKTQASTVMFIPSTKNGILLKMMKENEEKLVEMTGFRVSYAESGGTQLGRYFSTNLASGQPCGREGNKCIPCNRMDTKLQNCKARSIVYESSCEVCNPPSIEQGGPSLEEDKHHQEPREAGEQSMADPSLGRVGIYIGETSRSLAERCAVHFSDAASFSK